MSLKEYLIQCQKTEHKKWGKSVEQDREMLLKYFNDYTFETDDDMYKFLQCFNIFNHRISSLSQIRVEGCEELFQEKYTIKANIDITNRRVKLISNNNNIYSYNESTKQWHEGYEPFDGDINKCYGETQEEAIKTLYVSQMKSNFPLGDEKRIGLITSGTGYGKTNYVEDKLIDEINDARFANTFKVWNDTDNRKYYNSDILFITTRSSILKQQLDRGKVVLACENDFIQDGILPIYETRDDRVRIISTFSLGRLFKEGKIKKMFPVVVIDEIHSLFLDATFAEDAYFCIKCIQHYWESTIKLGLTATPLLLTYIDNKYKYKQCGGDMFYDFMAYDLPHKYNTQRISRVLNCFLPTILRDIHPTDEEKVLVYCSSAKQAISNSKDPKWNNKSAYLISKHNKDYVKETEEQEPLREYVISNEKLPDGVNILFITSAYREGIELRDEKIKTIIIEACDEVNIAQVIGRIRLDTKKIIIVLNHIQQTNVNKMSNKYKIANEMTQTELCIAYGIQLKQMEKKGETLIIVKDNDTCKINEFIAPVGKYINDCFLQATNQEKDKVVKSGERQMLGANEYYDAFLNKYCKNEIITLNNSSEYFRNNLNLTIIDKYLDKRLYKQERDRLLQQLQFHNDPKNPKNILKQISKIGQYLRTNGYQLDKGKSNGEIYYIIKKS